MSASTQVLLIDNYDSFTYNLKQLIEALGYPCEVHRNDQITLQEIEKKAPTQIVISPGPGNPHSAGITLEMIRAFAGKIPILGVCLGHQAIGQAFGGRVVKAPFPKHGKVCRIVHRDLGLFHHIPNPFHAARYHSLVIDRPTLPRCLEITAESEDGLIMGIRHREFSIEGVQFHPESVATENGPSLVRHFLKATG